MRRARRVLEWHDMDGGWLARASRSVGGRYQIRVREFEVGRDAEADNPQSSVKRTRWPVTRTGGRLVYKGQIMKRLIQDDSDLIERPHRARRVEQLFSYPVMAAGSVNQTLRLLQLF